MAHERLHGTLRHLRRVFDGEQAAGTTDAQLLERFLSRHDEAAFELLVWRHERMVLSVCRRVLHDDHEAEDAFQATFLVLVRKAGSIGRREAVASWLYRVAYRCALRARKARAKRSAEPGHDLTATEARPAASSEETDLWLLLQDEVARLPEKYRAPFVLCYLEGKTYDEAAGQLTCPKGTLSTRLTKARELLRDRLVRRGVTLSAGALAVVLGEQAARAAVPATLIDSTVRAALAYAAGKGAAAGVVPARVAFLTEGVIQAMGWTRFKMTATGFVLAAAMLAGGVLADQRPAAKQAAAPKVPTKPAAGTRAPSDQERLQGVWRIVSVTADGQKVEQAEIKDCRLRVEDDTVTLTVGREADVGTLSIDPTRKPKWIDVKVGDGRRGTGIYQLDGDTLKVCAVDGRSDPRPTSFEPGPKRAVIVFQRVPTDKDEKLPPAQPRASRELRILAEEARALRAEAEAQRERSVALQLELKQLKRLKNEPTFILKKVDIAASAVSVSLPGTTLALEAIPIATTAKFSLDGKETRIDDLKAGMKASLVFVVEDGKTYVTAIKASTAQ